jgi:hypothetical protein
VNGKESKLGYIALVNVFGLTDDGGSGNGVTSSTSIASFDAELLDINPE